MSSLPGCSAMDIKCGQIVLYDVYYELIVPVLIMGTFAFYWNYSMENDNLYVSCRDFDNGSTVVPVRRQELVPHCRQNNCKYHFYQQQFDQINAYPKSIYAGTREWGFPDGFISIRTIGTVKPVNNDHLMWYFSASWSSSRWPRAT